MTTLEKIMLVYLGIVQLLGIFVCTWLDKQVDYEKHNMKNKPYGCRLIN